VDAARTARQRLPNNQRLPDTGKGAASRIRRDCFVKKTLSPIPHLTYSLQDFTPTPIRICHNSGFILNGRVSSRHPLCEFVLGKPNFQFV
jgi:hypothetical protein